MRQVLLAASLGLIVTLFGTPVPSGCWSSAATAS